MKILAGVTSLNPESYHEVPVFEYIISHTVRFDSIRFDSIRFDSIRFDSIRFDSVDIRCTSGMSISSAARSMSACCSDFLAFALMLATTPSTLLLARTRSG